jgi:hypothetical protein
MPRGRVEKLGRGSVCQHFARFAPSVQSFPHPHSSHSAHHLLRHVPPAARPALLEGTLTHNQLTDRPLINPRAQDLGKSSNDLLGKDFPFHGTSLEVKTATPSNTTFRVAGVRDAKSNAIAGDIEAKYVNRKNGLVFTQAWTTANVLRSQVELENYMAKGLKLDLTTGIVPDKNTKSALVNATYKQPGLHGRAFLDLFKVRRLCSVRP